MVIVTFVQRVLNWFELVKILVESKKSILPWARKSNSNCSSGYRFTTKSSLVKRYPG